MKVKVGIKCESIHTKKSLSLLLLLFEVIDLRQDLRTSIDLNPSTDYCIGICRRTSTTTGDQICDLVFSTIASPQFYPDWAIHIRLVTSLYNRATLNVFEPRRSRPSTSDTLSSDNSLRFWYA
jgi:hypothetical protein